MQRAGGADNHDDEVDDMAADLAAMGVADLDAWLEASRAGDDEDEPLVVWPENRDAVQVFIRCTWQRTAVSDGQHLRLVPTGIAAGEIRHVAELLRVPRAGWPQLLDDVRLMAKEVLPALQAM